MVLLVALAITSVVMADDISNNLDGTIDAVAEVMPLNVGGANGTTQLYVTPRNGDNKNGCNLTGSTTLTISVSSSNTSVATVSPSSVTFTACSDTNTLTITPLSQGSTTISVSQTSNTTDGTFNLAPATFTVNVAPPANNAPTVVVAGVTGGASYNKGSVPTAMCQVTDDEDGTSSFPATLSAVTGPYASDGIGSQTASCSYTDAGGLFASASETYSIVDPSEPVIGNTLNPASADGSNGWYKSNVSLTWTVTENESPSSLVKTGCEDQNIAVDQAVTTYSCSATSAGGSAGPVSVSIKRDATAPSVSLVGGPENGSSYFFYSVPAEPTCSANDLLSGLNGTCSVSGYSTAIGTHTVTASAIDNAGNTASASATYTVKKASVTATAGSGTATYDGDVHMPSECVVSGDFTGDLSCTNDPGTVGPNAGIYEIAPVVSGTGLDNFEVSAVSGSFTIEKATSTTTVTCAAGPFVYTGSPITPCTATVTGPAGLNQSLQVSYTNNINVGPATASATYAESTNYLGSSDTEMFSILAWTLKGFYQPVDMGLTVVNTVKGGSTVPLKFEVFAGNTELTDTSIVSTLAKQVTCNATAEDTVEVLATGGTSLRYDTVGGQFIFNWQTPKLPGKCYSVTVTTQDGSSLVAFFKLK